MGKAHRDNHAARLNRGPEAFNKKNKRRRLIAKREAAKCVICGNFKTQGICLVCKRRGTF